MSYLKDWQEQTEIERKEIEEKWTASVMDELRRLQQDMEASDKEGRHIELVFWGCITTLVLLCIFAVVSSL